MCATQAAGTLLQVQTVSTNLDLVAKKSAKDAADSAKAVAKSAEQLSKAQGPNVVTRSTKVKLKSEEAKGS